MDISMRCPCSSELALVEAPEAMACHTVAEWLITHAPCVVNAQVLMLAVMPSAEEEDEEEDSSAD